MKHLLGTTEPVTDSSVEKAEALIVEDPAITIKALELGSTYGTALAIVHEQLDRCKKCARQVPHQLTKESKEQGVTICRNCSQEFVKAPKRFPDVVMGDKCSNMVWLVEDEPRPEV